MRLILAGLAALVMVASTLAAPATAQNAGHLADQTFKFPGPDGEMILAGVWLPEHGASDQPHPLIVMSHGNGAWYGAHADTARALARAGYVVAALSHPGDTYEDESRATALTRRAPQLSALIDHMTGEWRGPVAIDAGRIGAFGFSAGGFTVTQAIGGAAELDAIKTYCDAQADHFPCRLLAAGPPAPSEWKTGARDGRIRAAVIAAPGFGMAFTRDSLGAVTIPVQLWRAEQDQALPSPFHVEPVRDALGRAPDYRVEAAAGHLDFLEACTTGSTLPPPLCVSAPGFDRAAFKARFNVEVVAFFDANLTPSAP